MTLHVRTKPACLWKRGRDAGVELCDLLELGVTYMVHDSAPPLGAKPTRRQRRAGLQKGWPTSKLSKLLTSSVFVDFDECQSLRISLSKCQFSCSDLMSTDYPIGTPAPPVPHAACHVFDGSTGRQAASVVGWNRRHVRLGMRWVNFGWTCHPHGSSCDSRWRRRCLQRQQRWRRDYGLWQQQRWRRGCGLWQILSE